MVQNSCWEETMNSKRQERLLGSEDLRGELQGELEGPQRTESRDDAEAWRNFWSIEGDFIQSSSQ